jgi:branched-chain amino acid transport system substrate-binding protein
MMIMTNHRTYARSIFFVLTVLIGIFLIGCAENGGGGSGNGGAGADGGAAAVPGDGAAGGGAEGSDAAPVAVSEWEYPLLSVITGTGSDDGIAAAWGFDFAIQRINEKGGVRGVPVKSTIRDISGGAEKVTAGMSAALDGFLVVFGPAVTADVDTALSAAFDAKTPVTGAAVPAALCEKYQPYAISASASAAGGAASAVTAFAERDSAIKSICVFYDPTNSGSAAGYEKVKTALSEAGITLSAAIEVGNDTFDAAAFAKNAIDSGADAFYIDLPAERFARIVPQLQNAKVSANRILGGAVAALGDPAAEGTENFDGVWFWSWLELDAAQTEWKAFADAYRRDNGGEPDDVAAELYESVFLVKQAVEALSLTGEPDLKAAERQQLAEYLYNVDRVASIRGVYRIENGVKIANPSLYKIEKGVFKAQ